MSGGPEWIYVEQPLIDQLVRMGWKHNTGNLDHPSATGRESFRDVFIEEDLRRALHRVNHNNDGQPWMDKGRIDQAIGALARLAPTKLLDANKAATELLLKGTVVDGVEGWDQGRGRTVHFIDWEHPENNTFCVINQFKLACPLGQEDKHIIPDLVLFVNGIPLVVIEAKAPKAASQESPLTDAINQLQRYANRRRALGVVNAQGNEGNEQLFHYVQFMVVTCQDDARVGTFSSQSLHYLAWRDTTPYTPAEVAAELGKAGKPLTAQEQLVAGMLRPANLLEIVRHFTLFMEAGSAQIKVVCRYQQFRAVQSTIQRLLQGKTREEDGERDQRGGIIWHTQGSGKSLTMVFLIRKMRADPKLRRFKVVVVTDRRDLQRQLAETARLTDEVLNIPSSVQALKEELRQEGRDLIFAMIQKYKGSPVQRAGGAQAARGEQARKGPKRPALSAPMPALNESPDILLIVDEAHRSHTSEAHANMMSALPRSAKVGFTGTPIIMREKGNTEKIFGSLIDRYTVQESEADGATVPIFYEGRTVGADVAEGDTLDARFEDHFAAESQEVRDQIKQKFATKAHVLEAVDVIEEKARDMLRHYIACIMPNAFKAQVVAVSRRAAIRYAQALVKAQGELVKSLEALPSAHVGLSDEQIEGLTAEEAFFARAHKHLALIRRLSFAPVISSKHNDDVDPERVWSAQAEANIARFKRPLMLPGATDPFDPEKTDQLAFLVVKSMLLTGFDAPNEQVMYLDRSIKEAELLQAIARVNRAYLKKKAGFVVDYYGVAKHLKEALAAYSVEDVQGVMHSLKDEIPKLRDQHYRVMDVFRSRGLDLIRDEEACVDLLEDEGVRAGFFAKLKGFLTTLDLVMPRRDAAPFLNDAKRLAFIRARIIERSRSDDPILGQDVGAQVRDLIDTYVQSRGVNPLVPPVDINSADFEEAVERALSPKAKASEMAHALRYHVSVHMGEDPKFYETLSARLKGILSAWDGSWEEIIKALRPLIEEAKAGRLQDGETSGLDPHTEAPFFALIKGEVEADKRTEEGLAKLKRLTVEVVAHIRREVKIIGFWNKVQARDDLRSWLIEAIDNENIVPFERIEAVVDKLMELAKTNHHRLST